MLEFFGIFFLIVFVLSFIHGYRSKGSKAQPSAPNLKNKSVSKSRGINFESEIPNGYVIFDPHIQIAGIHFHKDSAFRFMESSNQSLAFEAEPTNKFDKNAIKVKGISSIGIEDLGYLPKEISASIIEKNLIDKVKPRLRRIYRKAEYIEIQLQLIGDKNLKSSFFEFFNNQPANKWQLLFYNFFKLPIPEQLTTYTADIFIEEYSNKLKIDDPKILLEFESYVDILNELLDEFVLDNYGIKKPTLDEINLALSNLVNNGYTFMDIKESLAILINELTKLNPKLAT